MTKWFIALSACFLVLSACDRPQASAHIASSAGVVDSILPIEAEIGRFKAAHALTSKPLSDGARSRAELVQLFIAALERSDTMAVLALALDPAEFIEVYYPHSPYAQPPFQQSPAFVWFQFQQNSRKGIIRALNRYGGQPASYHGHDCWAKPVIHGKSSLWQNCVVHWDLPPASLRLFGSIIEYEGQFKFVSFANDL